MEAIPRDLGKWRQFDRYCKPALKREAIDCLREQKHRRDYETTLSAVPKAKGDKLCTVDSYHSDSFVFRTHGCSPLISNERVAEAVERVLRYNKPYTNSLCTRTFYNSCGFPHVCLDEYMKRPLEIKLIHAIVTTD